MADPGCAIRATVLALVFGVLIYILVHARMEPDPARLTMALEVSKDGRFKCRYRDDVLDHFFARDKVNEWKQRTEEKCLEFRKESAAHRMLLFESLRRFLLGSINGATPPGGAWHLQPSLNETNILWIKLPDLVNWMVAQKTVVIPAKTNSLNNLIQQFKQLDRDEAALRTHIKAEIGGLDSNVSFDWFRIHEWRWTVEVFFWCLFGVLANTFITLIYAAREGRYDAREFLLVIPKAALAPVLAVVIIAWWATGLSESKINFVNLPYFLVLSFALGFVTENLYVKIKELGNLVVGPSTTVSAAKLEAAARRDVYKFVNPDVDVAALAPAENIPQLRSQLRAAAKAGMERGVVSQTAGNQASLE